MRTTLTLDDDLLAQAKARAALRGTTLGEVVADALREAFSRPTNARSDLAPLPAFGAGGLQPGVDIADSASLWEVDDAETGWRDRG